MTSPSQPAQIPPQLITPAILCLSLAAFASGMSVRVTDPLLPRLASEFQIPLGDASYVITFFAIAYGLAQLFFGPLGDRFGKYRVIAAACAASAGTALLCGLAPNFQLLLAARLLAGISTAAVLPLSMAWIGDSIPYESRQPVLARFLIGQILGVSAGVLAGGLGAEHAGWRMPFFLIALCFALISVVLFSLNRRMPSPAVSAQGGGARRLLSEFVLVLARPWARIVIATVFLEGMFLFGSFAFIASHLHRVHGLTLSSAGMVVMLFGFGGLMFATASKILVERLGEIGLVRWGGSLAAASLLLVALAPQWWWTIPACLVNGLGFYMMHNTLQINATQMAPERRGAAVAAFASFYFLGQSAGARLGGIVVESFSTTHTITIGALGVLAIAWNFSRLRARRPQLEGAAGTAREKG